MNRRPSWPALALGAIPFVAICFTVGVWDRIHPVVVGLPFNVFWLMLWMVLTPVCLWGAYRFERHADDEDRRGPPEEPR